MSEKTILKAKKSVILFGASGRLKKYLKILELQYNILFICDNDDNKWVGK